jgi:quinol monooxygenase YgiN
LKEEPGCLRFDICTDPERPGDVMLYEVYTDADAFPAHMGTRHFKVFDAAAKDMIAGKHVEQYSQMRPAHDG